MTTVKQLAALKALSAAKLNATQVGFAQVRSQEQRLRENLKQLVADRRVTRQYGASTDAAFIAGADVRWHKWVEARRAVINTELAQVLSRKLQLKEEMRHAFGKDLAISEIMKHEMTMEKRQHRRRSD